MLNLLTCLLLASGPGEADNIFVGYRSGLPYLFEAEEIPGKDLKDNQLYLNKEASWAWKDMISAAARDGVFLQPSYAFRSHELQREIKKRNRRLAAKPGFSSHEYGLSVDISGTVKWKGKRPRPTTIFTWLKQNAHLYGFYNNIPGEYWHWTYLGDNV